MRTNLFIAILLWVAMAACTEEAKMNMAEEKSFAPAKNPFRVTKIEGTNEQWGDYTLTMKYDNEKLTSCTRLDQEGDTVGVIRVSRSSDVKYTFEVEDFVAAIDADSIRRLDEELKATYGAGNYSLKDSIPLSSQTRLSMVVDLYTDGRVIKQTATYYVPQENPGTGEDFKYAYLRDRRTTDLYEYDGDGRICACREFYDVFDHSDEAIYTRSLYKDTYLYENGVVSEIAQYEAPSGEDFIEYNRFAVRRDGNAIASLVGSDGSEIRFDWANAQLATIQDKDGTSYSYGWDANGNVTEIRKGSDYTMRITYEPGHGNFSWLTSQRHCLYGWPYVK